MFSQKSEGALREETILASQDKFQAPTTAQISHEALIPGDCLAKGLRSLSWASLAHSQRGPGRGLKLARDPAELTVLQVVNAVDPRTRIQSYRFGLEHHRELCPLHSRLASAIATVEEAFANTTVAELVPRPTRKQGSCQFPCVSSMCFGQQSSPLSGYGSIEMNGGGMCA
jgi:Rrf2 family nitric oxide-sensitive transcriptional repressor